MPTGQLAEVTRLRLVRRRRAEALAVDQAGVVSRRQLYGAGVTRAEVRANVRAQRWRRVGRQCLVVHRGPLGDDARRWVAIFEAGPRAHLDGVSSLQAAGLTGFQLDRVRVSVPRGAKIWRAPGVDIRQTRRFDPDDVVPSSPPRSRTPVAAVRGALWAGSDRQAALILTMSVQQGLTTPQQLGEAMLRIRRDKRRAFLHQVILDLLDGVRSLGELDLARELRRRGLPEPSRQSVRRGKDGRYYLDVFWEDFGVVVEVDGIHHALAENIVPDAVRHNAVALRRDIVLRVPLLGLRVEPDTFYAQIEQALRAGGWHGPLRPTA